MNFAEPAMNYWIPFSSRSSKAEIRLFCLPYAGGSAAAYRAWSAELPPEIQVCSIELPGRGTRFRETPMEELLPLARAVCKGIYPYLDRPFVVFGHSMGAKLGFEVCRELQDRFDVQPSMFFASGTTAPHVPELNPAHQLSEEELIKRLQCLNPREGALRYPELLKLVIPVLRADLCVSENYVYKEGPALKCPLIALGGNSDPEAPSEHMVEWKRHTEGLFKVKILSGDHFFINTERKLLLHTILEEIRGLKNQRLNGNPNLGLSAGQH